MTQKNITILSALIISTILLFIIIIQGQFVFDDNIIITANQKFYENFSFLKNFTSSYWADIENRGLYRPLTKLSYYINHFITGFNPHFFRLFNVIIYIIILIYLYCYLRFFIDEKWVLTSFIFLFAIHPLHIETISSTAYRTGLLSNLFIILTIYHFYKYRIINKPKYLIFGTLTLISGFLSKENSYILPGLLIIQEYYLFTKLRNKKLKYIILTFLLLFAIITLKYNVTGLLTVPTSHSILHQLNWYQRIGLIITNYINILFKTFLPIWKLTPVYNNPEWNYFIIIQLISIIFLITIITHKKLILFIFFIITLPVSNIVPIEVIHADRFYFLCPVLLLFILIRFYKINKKTYKIIFFTLFLFFLYSSINLAFNWQTDNKLWKYTNTVLEDNDIAINNLGYVYMTQKKYDKALDMFYKANKLKPEKARYYANIGMIYELKKEFQKAVKYYKLALQFDKNNIVAQKRIKYLMFAK